MYAFALLCTAFVAIVALTASEAPLPLNELPPEDVALESAVATMIAVSCADSDSEAAVSVTLARCASTVLRTSLSTTIPPTAVESDVETFRPCGISVVSSTGCQ